MIAYFVTHNFVFSGQLLERALEGGLPDEGEKKRSRDEDGHRRKHDDPERREKDRHRDRDDRDRKRDDSDRRDKDRKRRSRSRDDDRRRRERSRRARDQTLTILYFPAVVLVAAISRMKEANPSFKIPFTEARSHPLNVFPS